MMEPLGIRIGLAIVGDHPDDEVLVGDEIVVAVSLSHTGEGKLHHVREMQFDVFADGFTAEEWTWKMGRRRRRTYRIDDQYRHELSVVRANSLLSEPPYRHILNLKTEPKVVGFILLIAEHSGTVSVVGDPAKEYSRDHGFRLGTGYGQENEAWETGGRNSERIEHEPLVIEIG